MTEGRKRKPFLIAGVITGAMLVLLLFTALTFPYNDRILNGVSVDGIKLDGKTIDQATELLQPVVSKIVDRSITLAVGDQTWSYPAGQLGLKVSSRELAKQAEQVGRQGSIWQRSQERYQAWQQGIDLPLAFQVDQTILTGKLANIDSQLSRAAQDAAIQITVDRQIKIVPGKNGQAIDMAKSTAAIKSKLTDPSQSRVELSVAVKPPTITTEQIKAWGINGIVASYTTKFSAAKIARSYNIKIAAEALQDTLIMGGAVFSFNQTVGPRTIAAGYQEALVIENNEFVPGLAGGICQMVSTLYNGMLLSGFSVVERHPHSLPVVYVPPGLDATVSGMAVDLKMQNTFATPVILHTEYRKGWISVYIFGPTELKPEVRLFGRRIKTIPFGEVRVLDKTLAPGSEVVETKGVAGMEAEAVRQFLKDGKVISKEILSHNRYKPLMTKIRVGPKVVPAVPAAPVQPTEQIQPL